MSPQTKDQKIGSLRVQAINFRVDPPGDFSAWAQTEVTDLTRGKPDAFGQFDGACGFVLEFRHQMSLSFGTSRI